MKNAGDAEQPATDTSAAGSVVPPATDEQHGTRNKVARSILDHGPSTAAQLALRLGLTQAAVRRHLDTLVGEGTVESREQRVYGSRRRGRPARVFALTDYGRDAFDQDYDRLAVDALRWIAQSAGGGELGAAAVAAFARARMAGATQRYREAIKDAEPQDRVRALARALTEDGYAATAREAPTSVGEQLCQHHCPVAHVAERFPQLCEVETEVFSELLGTHVQRLATIAHGDGVCTTFVPRGQSPPRAGPQVQRTGNGTAPRHPKQTTQPPKHKPSTTASSKRRATTASAQQAGRNPA
ncbi:ArsR family transcriptional regulator [Streptomyces sp. NPDC005438]|uniref:helix-turn-helix transcriptional regulator n=1 Tax=Streptomyces sp. NPDC005438 TaxID=3156880 RepID=UPI0033ADD829